MEVPDSDQEKPPSPAESLALIEAARRLARQELVFSEAPFYFAWGVAWLVAFGATHLIVGGDPPALGDLPEWLAGVVWLVAIVGATAFSIAAAARRSRGIGGLPERIGKRLAAVWPVALVSAGLMTGALGIQGPESGALFVFAVALLYMGAGAMVLDDLQIGIGVWLAIVNVVALFAGSALYALLLSIFGGGALLAGGVLAVRRDSGIVADAS